jgi:hypothetical protein
MEEIAQILTKYDEEYIRQNFTDVVSINAFALSFYKDVAEIYDTLTRVKNVERNPNGFDLDDAPILGLLVRIWKLLKEIIRSYEQDNAEIISILERPLIEAAVMATYLMRSSDSVIEDYRKCSYQNRLRILRNLKSGSPLFETKAGKRLLNSVQNKMLNEQLTTEDFGEQEKNSWKVQGKSFYKIFALVEDGDLYACTYGIMSESIHGSWNESMGYCLSRNTDGTYSAYPFSQPADIRYVSPTLLFANKPFRLWLERIEAADPTFVYALDWIDRLNRAIFRRFDESYDG